MVFWVSGLQRGRPADAGSGAAGSQSSVAPRLVLSRSLPGRGLEVCRFQRRRSNQLVAPQDQHQSAHFLDRQLLALRRQAHCRIPGGRRTPGVVCRRPPLADRRVDETVRRHRFPAAQNARQSHHLLPAGHRAAAGHGAPEFQAMVPPGDGAFQRPAHTPKARIGQHGPGPRRAHQLAARQDRLTAVHHRHGA